MKNRLLYSNALSILSFFAVYFSKNDPSSNLLLVNPPSFSEPAPQDVTIACVDDFPAPVSLQATDDNDPSFPKAISPVDFPAINTIDPCVGGIVKRLWIATDVVDMLSDTLEQVITILPDNTPPVVNIAERHDTVSCETANFIVWLNGVALQLATNYDECDIDDIDDDAPANFTESCGTVMVTFTLTDECGNATLWRASYTIEDEEAPQLAGLPTNLNLTLSCTDPVPPVPIVTATDNCTDVVEVEFTEDSGQTNDGTCSQYDYLIIRTWTATDSCGNQTTATQRITVRDMMPPTFTVPIDTFIACDEDPQDLDLTGNVIDATDNCSPTVMVTFSDMIIDSLCPHEFTIQRTWRAEDLCGNTLVRTQFIEIVDEEAPSFLVPSDITVSCEQGADPNITGTPTMVNDNCDNSPIISYVDKVIGGNCVNTFTVERTWKVTDACGDSTKQVQVITVTDDKAPFFATQAQDLILICENELDPVTAFSNWITTRGGATAADNCTPDGDLIWFILESGTSNPAAFPPAVCPAPDSIVRMLAVDFIVQDECGNRDTSTAVFQVIDDQPPSLSACPGDTTIATDPGICGASFVLAPPLIEEECPASLNVENLSLNATISSDAAPGEEGDVPVNPINLEFTLATAAPINAAGAATLTIILNNVDGEEATEFFKIIGEDGSPLGQTVLANGQCGQSTTMLNISQADINAWAVDGKIGITLVPNIPENQPGRFSINAICNPAGMIDANLQLQTKNFNGLTYEYSINDGLRVAVSPVAPVSVSLGVGQNTITYYVTDCIGMDSCSYTVTVEDEEPPLLNCPNDITVSLAQGVCTAPITLPLPLAATDNCGVGNPYQRTLPANLDDAYLTFNLDPNLNEYLANPKIFTYTDVAANATGPVHLGLELLGDFDSNDAFFTVLGDDGSVIGTTQVGMANCTTPGQVDFVIPAVTFNTWAADGMVRITLQPKNITVPPGLPGDGINPCDPMEVINNGDTDGTSLVFISLSYNQLEIEYFATGATTLAPSVMMPPAVTPTINFNVGETTVFYIVKDVNNSSDTCSFTITVEDNEAPLARCQPTTIFINPSGLDIETIPAAVIDAGSMDNCGIDTMFLTPNTFNCLQAETNATVTLTVIDFAGNQATCTALVRIESEEPQPTATTGLCGGDTLFLFANPPAATGGIIYTYRWTGPNGFFSTQENPRISNVNAANAGTYVVEVTGLTLCKSVGSVQVAIEDLPFTPTVLTKTNVCVNEDIILNSSVVPSGSAVTYRWYRGTPPSGTLIGTTAVPSFTIPQPHSAGTNNYYLTVEADGCLSAPSAPTPVTTNSIPVAVVNDEEITICEGESITLGTLIAGPGITYQWTGPNNYSATNQFPPVISSATMANAGVYRLVVFRNGCPSPPAFTVVNILPKPATPQITNTSPVCEGSTVVLSTNIAGASVYHWLSPTLQEFLTTTNTFTINNATEAQEGNWRVFVTQAGCNSSISLPTAVVVNTIPVTLASANPNAVCEGGTLQLFASPTLPGATYRWTGPNGYSDARQNPTLNNINQNGEGTYELTLTTQEGCSNKATVAVDVLQGVFITAVSNDGPSCLPGPKDIKLTASVFPPNNGTYQYRWTGPNFASSNPEAVIPNATSANNGNYQLIVTNGNGCASAPATTIVDVNDPPATPLAPTYSASTPGPSFCVGRPIMLVAQAYNGNEVIYSWKTPKGTVTTATPALTINSATMADNGLYSLIVIVDGCLSKESAAIGVKVNPLPQVFASSNSPLCNGDTIRLTANVIPGATYEWNGPGGFTSSRFNPVIFPANPSLNNGVYRVAATLNGCTSDIDSIGIEVKPRPRVPVASNSGPVCISNDNAVLRLSVSPASAVQGATYTWYNQFANVIGQTQNLNLDITDFDDYEDGPYLFTVTSTVDGCSSAISAPTIATLNTIPNKPAVAGMDKTVCEADSISLNAAAPDIGLGLWTLTKGNDEGLMILQPNNPNSAIKGLQGDSTYVFRWTLSNGACIDYDFDEVSLSVTPIEIAFAGFDTLVCATDQIQLGAQLPISGEGRWSQPQAQAALGVRIIDPLQPNTLITGLEPGNEYLFTWTIVSGCGGLADDIIVSTSDTAPFAGDDKIVCNDTNNATLDAASPSIGSFGRWSSPNPNIFFSNDRAPNAMVSNLDIGDNLFIWTIDNALCGNNSRDTTVVTLKNNPKAQEDAIPIAFGESKTFDATENDQVPSAAVFSIITQPSKGTLENLGDGRFIYTPNINFVGADEARYEICSEGCNCASATIRFTVGEGATCEPPSVITPNNDGINDLFVIPCMIDGRNFPGSQVLIFNRWGDEVFRSPVPYQNNWDGTFNGEDLPAGTYFYVVKFGDDFEDKTGFIMIQR